MLLNLSPGAVLFAGRGKLSIPLWGELQVEGKVRKHDRVRPVQY